MSPPGRRLADTFMCFPRVSGDEPWVQFAAALITMFSPRERG